MGLRTLLTVIAMTLFASSIYAAAPRVLPEGKVPNDARLKPPKDLNGYFPFAPAKSVEAWETRVAGLRRQLLVSLGLWPMPTKTPLNAVIHGKIERPEYTVEKVYFESYPGFFVTGSLYRPKNVTGKVPGVLVPYGHHRHGRFNEESVQEAENMIAEGAERFVSGGRYPLQAMCVTLARMGCIAFEYDMVGYADSKQLSYDLTHNFFGDEGSSASGQRGAGFFSVAAELQCQNIMGLQTYDSIRALDFLLELPEVDSARIGVTGASGGGTQTMILAALDPRVTATAPVVMVSTSMQGGCTCENACYLRIDTGNVEFAAMFAPKPQCLVAADDWTREFGSKGLPELQQHYQLLGAPKNLRAKLNIHFPHNYNYVSREVMYQWFNKHLKLGQHSPVLEEAFEPIATADLSVWDKEHPQPPSGDAFEQSLCKWIAEDSAKQIGEKVPEERQKLIDDALAVMLGGGLPAKEDLEVTVQDTDKLGKYIVMPGLLRRKSIGTETPFVMLASTKFDVPRTVVWIDDAGKAGLFGDDGQPIAEVRKLLDANYSVVGVDLFLQGEFNKDGKSPEELRRVEGPRKSLSYTLGYNYPAFSQRVRDILSMVAYLKSEQTEKEETIDLVGFGSTGKLVAAAITQSGDAVERAAVDTAGFRFASLKSLWDIDILPGAVKYGDLPGMLSRAKPKHVWVAGEDSSLPVSPQKLSQFDGPADQRRMNAVTWLIEH